MNVRQLQCACRRTSRRFAALGLVVCAAAAAAVPAAAAAGAFPREAPPAAPWHPAHVEGRTVQRRSVSLQEAVAIAQRRFPGGRVIRAETRTRNGARVHEIRIIDGEGRVRTVRIDADSGQVR